MIKYLLTTLLMISFGFQGQAYQENGKASYYHDMFNGRLTANGETFDQRKMSAAHKSLPFNSIVKVTREDNGHFIIVRINDRGPYVSGRIIDLSRKAGEELGIMQTGTTNVTIEVISQAIKNDELVNYAKNARVEAIAATPKATPKPSVLKNELGLYELNGAQIVTSFNITKMGKNTMNFNYVSHNTTTNCKLNIDGEAFSMPDGPVTWYELEDGKKIKIRDYRFIVDNTEVTVGVSSDYQRVIIRRRDTNSNQDASNDCQYFSDAWLERKRASN